MSSGDGRSQSLPAHLLQLATLQLVTRSSPFTHSRTLPLHTFSHLISDYLQLLARAAKDNAELAGRTDVSVWDVGRALDEFGTGGLSELREEMMKGDGGDDADRIRDLGGTLKGTLACPSHLRPWLTFFGAERLGPFAPEDNAVAQLSYLPLRVEELIALETPADTPSTDQSDASSDDDSMPESPAAGLTTLVKLEDDDALIGQLMHHSVDDKPVSSWRDPDLIPAHVPEFLPPFPGMERERDVPETGRRRREQDMDRNAAAEAWAGANAAGSSLRSPWIVAIPYASSSLAEVHPVPALPRLSPPPVRRRRRSLSPPPVTSSIPAYNEVVYSIPHAPTWPRPNPKRRLAASAISISSDQSISADSLFGSLPIPPIHSASLTPGFVADGVYAPLIHPFNNALPHTIALPASAHPSPHATLLAPPPHARIPSILPSVAAHLSHHNSPHLSLFSRLTRIGPPGPLGPKGEALEYEYVGNSAVLASNVEWPVRMHNARLPGTGRGNKQHAVEEEGSSGIKLNLKSQSGRRSESLVGTPAAAFGADLAGWPEEGRGVDGEGVGTPYVAMDGIEGPGGADEETLLTPLAYQTGIPAEPTLASNFPMDAPQSSLPLSGTNNILSGSDTISTQELDTILLDLLPSVPAASAVLDDTNFSLDALLDEIKAPLENFDVPATGNIEWPPTIATWSEGLGLSAGVGEEAFGMGRVGGEVPMVLDTLEEVIAPVVAAAPAVSDVPLEQAVSEEVVGVEKDEGGVGGEEPMVMDPVEEAVAPVESPVAADVAAVPVVPSEVEEEVGAVGGEVSMALKAGGEVVAPVIPAGAGEALVNPE
jgi:hypothetical protein